MKAQFGMCVPDMERRGLIKWVADIRRGFEIEDIYEVKQEFTEFGKTYPVGSEYRSTHDVS